MKIQYLAIIVAAIITFAVSAIYYVVLNKQYQKLRGNEPQKGVYKISLTPNRIMIELVRNFILGLVIAYAVMLLGIVRVDQALILAVWLWVGFPVVLLTGMTVHENYPAGLAAIHAGDWLLKVLIFSLTITLWP